MKIAPITKPYLLQIDYGIISPMITIKKVEIINPMIPVVKSAINIDSAEFTATFPSKIALSNKFPLLLKGRILLAYLAYYSSSLVVKGPIVNSSKYFVSSPK